MNQAAQKSGLRTGLVSVTFRKLSWAQVIDCVSGAGLESIEWGGDVHVPHGDLKVAEDVRDACAGRGVTISAYGSYYRAGTGMDFKPVLDSALVLGAPTIRVWAGDKGSQEVDAEARERITEDLRRIATQAGAQGVGVDVEYHRNTLTDTLESTLKLLNDLRDLPVRSYWQKRQPDSPDQCVADLHRLRAHLGNVHVFNWLATGQHKRRALVEARNDWERYLQAVALDGGRFASLEFVKDDSVEQFYDDARTLRELVDEVNRTTLARGDHEVL